MIICSYEHIIKSAQNSILPMIAQFIHNITKLSINYFFFACTKNHLISAKRPECTTDPECPDHLACIREKCQNPCFTTTCGVNAECRVTKHRAVCVCNQGFIGDPYRICEERKNSSKVFEKESDSKITVSSLMD